MNNDVKDNTPGAETELNQLLDSVRAYVDDPTKGLPEDVFLFVSEMSPLPNVDLLVRDDMGRILLAWRDDPYCGMGWHVPGGIIRLKETFDDRIQRTAVAELGTTVRHGDEPIEVHQIIDEGLTVRSHHITLVYECKVPEGYMIDNGSLAETDAGCLAWHDHFPDQMLQCHQFYRKYFME